eukprot:896778-Pyramimonas_sp.AAC.1
MLEKKKPKGAVNSFFAVPSRGARPRGHGGPPPTLPPDWPTAWRGWGGPAPAPRRRRHPPGSWSPPQLGGRPIGAPPPTHPRAPSQPAVRCHADSISVYI